ncbi:hypothetical protein GCM10009083_14200 [Halopseudomonas pertucinogena]|uniref:Uncharacterized protein n=1 Tax=Halopseudomonas pertucinogena TaxID=86175 RepID=A0ABQ2CNW7_9GAMM|nr:hypothetical protein GCM10009083_14200 [Halopseudomonas pertucinogena]
MDAFFLAQALDEVQVAFVVLGAVVPFGILAAQLELEGVALDAVVVEHAGNDLRYRQVLEDALVGRMLQVGQPGDQRDAITGQALAGFTLGDTMDQPVHAFAWASETEKSGLVQPPLDIQVRVLTDQLHVKTIGSTDGFSTLKAQHLKVVL